MKRKLVLPTLEKGEAMSQSLEEFENEFFNNKNVQDIKVRYAYDAQIGYVIRGTLADCFDMNVVPLEVTYDVQLGQLELDAQNLLVTCSVDLTNGDMAFLGFTLHQPQRIDFDDKGNRVFIEPTVSDMELECRLADGETDLYYDFEGESWFDDKNHEYEIVSGGFKKLV